MPPLIVLGLTGPVGSGCTTLSKVLDNPDDPNRNKGSSLVEALRSVGWVGVDRSGEISIDWNNLNRQVDDLYAQRNQEGITRYGGNGDESGGAREQKRRLETMLELREAVKAISKLRPYHRKGVHLFRTLSVSDLIVFRALMAIEKADFNVDGSSDPKKKAKYQEFVALAREYMQSNQAQQALKQIGVESYGDFYKRCYESKKKEELEKLGASFYNIHGVARVIKKEYCAKHYLDYAEVLQDFGDNIRRCDDPFGLKRGQPQHCAHRLAKGISQMIYLLWKTRQGSFFVVDCLRNPYEVMYLRREFANFLLLSLFATEKTRQGRIVTSTKYNLRKLLGREASREEEERIVESFELADKRDSGRGVKGVQGLYKQNVTKCAQISDIAINNERQWTPADTTASEELCRKSLRILCLILSPGCTKPNDDELFMNLAYTMAVKSNCISRQVGAVIIGPDGYVVGAGWNDVGAGRISCGLRAIRDLGQKEFEPLVEAIRREGESKEELVHRLAEKVTTSVQGNFGEQLCFCLKDVLAEREAIPEYKARIKRVLGVEDERTSIGLVIGIKDFLDKMIEEDIEIRPPHQLEYCIALHGEENAILQSAKIGGFGLQGGTMYVTCQPCPLCAKKIQQVGLGRVIYTEAYPKSRPDIYMAGIRLEQFEGVKPRAYIKLFMAHHDQKEWQELESKGLAPEI